MTTTLHAQWFFPFLHVSSKLLIEEGLDDGSRTHAKQVRSRVSSFARRLGLEITINFFASSCNVMVARFLSWTEEPGYWPCLSQEAQALLMHVASTSDFEHIGKKKMVDHSVFFVNFGDGSDS